MPGKLVKNRALFEVPEGLTCFVHDDSHLVVKPHSGGRVTLTAREFGVLSALARSLPLDETVENEKALAKLVLNWVAYYNGHRPNVTLQEPKLKQAYYAITDGCNLRCPYCYASSEKMPAERAEHGRVAAPDRGDRRLRGRVRHLHRRRADAPQGPVPDRRIRQEPRPEVQHRHQRDDDQEAGDGPAVRRPVQLGDGQRRRRHRRDPDRTRGAGSFAKTHKALQLLNQVGVIRRSTTS